MQEHRTDNPVGGLTTITMEPEQENTSKSERKYLTDAQKRMREAILKRKGMNGDG